MRIDIWDRHGVTVIEPKGRITLETQPEFSAAVRQILDSGQRHLVLNLGHVPYIDSCGIGAIVHAYVSARRRGGDLKLLQVRDRNLRLLTITRLLTVFEAYGDEQEAARGFVGDTPGLPAS